MNLKLHTHKVGISNVVEVAGEVELDNAELLRAELLRATSNEDPCLIVDLSRVSFIDSTGVGVLVGAFKRVREIGTLSVVCPQRSVRRVFEITGLTQVFVLHKTVEDALHECTSSRNKNSSTDLSAHFPQGTPPVAEGVRDA